MANAQEYGVVTLSSINIRSKASYTSSLETQELMGQVVKILGHDRYWVEIECDQPYRGWTTDMCVRVLSEDEKINYDSAPKYIYTGYYGHVLETPGEDGEPVCDLVTGDLLRSKAGSERNGYCEVTLPDGRNGWVEKKYLRDHNAFTREWKNASAERKISNAIRFAKHTLGTPYLWGGMTPKGVDCSGLVRISYMMSGVYLPRNASQMIKMGRKIECPMLQSGNFNLSNLKAGDLLFFGNKDTGVPSHVAIYIGNGRFIHSSHLVRINSLNKEDKDYYTNSRRLIAVCRIVE